MNKWSQIKQCFHQGLELDDAGRRELLEGLPGSAERDEILSLWHYADSEETGLDFEGLPELTLDLLFEARSAILPQKVGPYRILKTLEGGAMASVYLAEQEAPMERLVVIKMLPAGKEHGEPMQRFLMEQRLLALLRHPNVATVLDRGLAPDGRPWFAIEYLEGLPLTTWCDRNQLGIKPRLGLFRQVCEGVAYAHGKGIIHRDLKPANILVTEEGGKAVPKIIDFGIAHLIAEEVNHAKTQAGSILGTPAYMSPERALGRPQDTADVRGDIYALGAILYELLTGETPLAQLFAQVQDTESLLRQIRTAVRPRPSECYQRDDLESRAAAERLGEKPRPLHQQIRGELDWITAKSLASELDRRYQSADALAADVNRYLAGFPVLAAPPRAVYQFRMFLRRHARLAWVSVAFLAVVLVGGIGITAALIRTVAAEREALAALSRYHTVNRFTLDLIREVHPFRQGQKVTGIELLDHAANSVGKTYRGEPEMEASTREVLGNVFRDLGRLSEAAREFETALQLRLLIETEDDHQILMTQAALAYVYHLQERDDLARDLYESCCAEMVSRFGKEDARTLRCRGGLAEVLAGGIDEERAAILFKEVMAAQKRVGGPNNYDTLATANNYANLLIRRGQPEEAEPLLNHKYRTFASQYGENHLLTIGAMNSLARLDQTMGRFDAAREKFTRVWRDRKDLLGDQHPETLGSLGNLLLIMAQNGQASEAASLFRQEEGNLAGLKQRKDAVSLRLLHNLGHTLMHAGELEDANAVLELTLAGRRELYGNRDPRTLYTWVTLAENHQKAGRVREAANMLEIAVNEASVHQKTTDKALFEGLWALALAELGQKERAKFLLQSCLPDLEAVNHAMVPVLVEAQCQLEN